MARTPPASVRETMAEKRKARQRAQVAEAFPAAPPTPLPSDLLMLRWDEITRDPNNARKAFDEEELALLADSIAEQGLLQNLVVTAAETFECVSIPQYPLVAGERRWRAIRTLIKDGRWPEDRLIACRLIAPEDAKARAIAGLLENLVRADLKPLEEAEAFKSLRDVHNIPTAEIAEKIHRTQRLVQQRLQLLDLSDKDRERLDRGELTVEEARRRGANQPQRVELTPAERLMLLEVVKAQGGAKESSYGNVNCQPSPPIGRFGLFHFSVDHWTGHDCVRREWQTDSWLDQNCPKWRKDLDGEIARAWGDLPADAPGFYRGADGYYTSWLNGPFEIPAERQQEIDRRAAEQAERDVRNAEYRAGEERKAIARTEAEDRLAVGDRGGDLLTTSLLLVGHPLPWRVRRGIRNAGMNHRPAILDALGQIVRFDQWGTATLLEIVAAVAVNQAAGLVTTFLEIGAEDAADLEDEAA